MTRTGKRAKAGRDRDGEKSGLEGVLRFLWERRTLLKHKTLDTSFQTG